MTEPVAFSASPEGEEDGAPAPEALSRVPAPALAADPPPPCGVDAAPVDDVPPPRETWGVVTLGTEADGVGVVETGVVSRGVETDGVVTEGTATGGGEGVVTAGVVTVATGGTGTVTLGTVTVGSGGVGSGSASACPPVRPSPKSKTRMAAPRTSL
jgi:hypothetical protein